MRYHRISLIMIIQLCGGMSLLLGDEYSSIYECNVTMSITYHEFFRKKITLLNLDEIICVHCTVLSIFLHD